MKKNLFKKIGILAVVSSVLIGSAAFAGEVAFGAKGAEEQTNFTLEEMLKYAIQDEYLAYTEYDVIMDEFGVDRPFSNIIKAEENHISELEALYDIYGFDIPKVDPSEHVVVPSSIQNAFETGIQAEIDNIAMYEAFLENDLPDDVRAVFEELKKGSESHLQAFSRNASDERGNSGQSTGTGNNGNRLNSNQSGYGNRKSDNRLYQNQKR